MRRVSGRTFALRRWRSALRRMIVPRRFRLDRWRAWRKPLALLRAKRRGERSRRAGAAACRAWPVALRSRLVGAGTEGAPCVVPAIAEQTAHEDRADRDRGGHVRHAHTRRRPTTRARARVAAKKNGSTLRRAARSSWFHMPCLESDCGTAGQIARRCNPGSHNPTTSPTTTSGQRHRARRVPR